MPKLVPWMVIGWLLASIAVCAGQDEVPAQSSTTQPEKSALRLSWSHSDHPSGIFYPNEHATLSILIENPTTTPLSLAGNFIFVRFGDMPADAAKPISITPISPAIIDGGQSAKIDLAVTFATPGTYQISWNDQPIFHASNTALQCIYAPRAADGPPADSPWIAALPQTAFADADFLADYSKQTGIHLFVWDCPWQPGQHDILGPDQKAITAPQLTAILTALKASASQLVIRLQPQLDTKAAARTDSELNTYAGALVAKLHGVCKGVVVRADPWDINWFPDAARDLYLAVYAGVKKQDHGVLMLGFSRAADTHKLLSGIVGKVHLEDYIDALAAEADLTDANIALALITKKRAAWILPPASGDASGAIPPAVALAGNAAVVPVPAGDRGVTLHLLGGAVLYQRLHPDTPPYIAVFQGNGFAVGVITGSAADVPFIDLIHHNPAPAADANIATLEVADPDGSLRVVDDKGVPIDCRKGDILHLPLDLRTCYLVESGSAEDLLAALRTAELHHTQPPK